MEAKKFDELIGSQPESDEWWRHATLLPEYENHLGVGAVPLLIFSDGAEVPLCMHACM